MSKEVRYNMQRGMVDYFMNLLSLPKGEVWGVIKDACHICVDKLNNNNKSKSWTYATVPGSDIKLRIDVERLRKWDSDTGKYIGFGYYCNVKFSSVSDNEQFTDAEVEDYIVEKILLAIDD